MQTCSRHPKTSLDTLGLDKSMNLRFQMARAAGSPGGCLRPTRRLRVGSRSPLHLSPDCDHHVESSESDGKQPPHTEHSSAAASNQDRRTRPACLACLACLSLQLPAKRGRLSPGKRAATSRHAKKPNQPQFLHHACAFATTCWCPE